tara:strand:+ start:183 stop:704 length:522 start_codon:yes stop_codon:yes gene_type:complete
MIKKIILYFRLFFSNDYSKAKLYGKYLGIKFGYNVRIIHFPRFGSEPYLIKIGDNVTITRGVSFITHDGGAALFRKESPGLNVFGRIIIGNNVFIGVNTIILPDVIIGDNVVIAAGSVVSKNIASNGVYGGIPAKLIKNIDDYEKSIFEKGFQINETNPTSRKEKIINFLNKK